MSQGYMIPIIQSPDGNYIAAPAVSINRVGQRRYFPLPKTNSDYGIKEVWACNLEEEFATIRLVVQYYPYIAIDTEFPGVVAHPIGEFTSRAVYHYQKLKCNVDLLKMIQLGLTFLNEAGESPPVFRTWQFNFKFNLDDDMYAKDSIDLLQKSGLEFELHGRNGIEPLEFAELLMTSGIVLVENIHWLCFHSDYDFGYLLKLLMGSKHLPEGESDFFEFLKLFFPHIYDIKYLMKSCRVLKGGLQEVADSLRIEREGRTHQAGSDSLLTGAVFFRMRHDFFEDQIDDKMYSGRLYGFGSVFISNGSCSNINSNADEITLPDMV